MPSALRSDVAKCSPRPTAHVLLAAAVSSLREQDVASPRLDAELLLASALNQSRSWLLANPDAQLAPDTKRKFDGFLKRRCRREPVSRILAKRSFWTQTFDVTPAVLDPRPDSETVVEAVLKAVDEENKQKRFLVADLGTGSGCILLALLGELRLAVGVGVDRDVAAVSVAQHNATTLGLADRASFVAGNWAAPLAGGFDIVTCNPPYLISREVDFAQPEVRYDPRTALDGGTDGLDAYRALIPMLPTLLAEQGRAFLEIGNSQASAVSKLATDAGLIAEAVKPDLAGQDRCVVLHRTGSLSGEKKLVGLQAQAD